MTSNEKLGHDLSPLTHPWLANAEGVTYEDFRNAMMTAQQLGMDLEVRGEREALVEGVQLVDQVCNLFPDYAERLGHDPVFHNPNNYR